MNPQDCPLPEVAEALGPFIKPRDEVIRIRLELQAFLAKQAGISGAPLTSVNLITPDDVKKSSAVSGVRKAYLQALRAHLAAQERYDALKVDLDRLSSSSEPNVVVRSSGGVNDNYIPLLRQREKQRKLQTVERAFTGITAAGKDTTTGHLDDIVRQRAGDLPTPPTAQQSAFSEKPDVEARILQLKKALLASKRKVEASDATSSLVNGTSHGGPEAEVAGLQSALNELTSWMEEKLAVIGNAENENESVPPTPRANGHAMSPPAGLEDMEALYEQYLEARRRLVETVNQPPPSDLNTDLATSNNGATSHETPKRPTPAEILLTHIKSLASARLHEQSLLQQSAYMRRQISTAEDENRRLIARLADESHLVHPGASKGRGWAEAAVEAGRATEEVARQRLQAGEASAEAAKKALLNIAAVPKLLDGLVGQGP